MGTLYDNMKKTTSSSLTVLFLKWSGTEILYGNKLLKYVKEIIYILLGGGGDIVNTKICFEYNTDHLELCK